MVKGRLCRPYYLLELLDVDESTCRPTNLAGHLSMSPPFIFLDILLFTGILRVTDEHVCAHVIQTTNQNVCTEIDYIIMFPGQRAEQSFCIRLIPDSSACFRAVIMVFIVSICWYSSHPRFSEIILENWVYPRIAGKMFQTPRFLGWFPVQEGNNFTPHSMIVRCLNSVWIFLHWLK